MEQKWSVPWSLLGSSWSYSRFHHPPLGSSVLCSPPCRCKTDVQWNEVVFTVLVQVWRLARMSQRTLPVLWHSRQWRSQRGAVGAAAPPLPSREQ